MFVGLVNEIAENPIPPRMLQINGKFVPFDPSTLDASMSVEVNPNLGKGNDMVRMMALSGIKQDQQALVAQMGLGNPICGPTEMLNTMTDMLKLANVMNVGRYFKTPNPMQMQQMLSAPKTPDPQAMAAQAMMEKVRSATATAVGQQASRPDAGCSRRTTSSISNCTRRRRSICRSSICRGSRWASTIMLRSRSWRAS